MADYLYIQVGPDLLGIQTGLAGTLEVTGTDGLSPVGEEGSGSYSPSNVVYTLTNTGTTSLNWTATDDAAWVSLSSASGTLAAGASTTVTVSIVAATIDALADGAYSATVTFTNTTNGNGNTTRAVSLTVTPASGGASAFAQYGITFTLDSAATDSGQYVTGDYWYTGAKAITITPHASDGLDGAMVDPGPNSAGQGWYSTKISPNDGAGYAYSSSLDVAKAASQPYTLASGSSLVATISGGTRPRIQAAAVLTREASDPGANAFRPNWAGSTKYRFTTADITYDNLTGAALPSLSVPSGTRPTLATVEGWFQRPWIDNHDSLSDGTQYLNPTDNMANYGQQHGERIGIALMYLCMDAGTIGDKTTLRNLLIQQGIDYYGMMKSGCGWINNGALNYWKKALVVLAAYLLDDATMKTDITTTAAYRPGTGTWAEDDSTWTVVAGDVSRVLDVQGDLYIAVGGTGAVYGTFTRHASATRFTNYLYGYASLQQNLMTVVSGTGSGQTRKITSESQSYGRNIPGTGTLTATGTPTTTSISCSSVTGLSSTTNAYVGDYVVFATGTLAGQARQITAYDGSTRTFTVSAFGSAPAAGDTFSVTVSVTPDTAWSPALDSTSVVRILGYQAAQTGSYPHRYQGTAEWGITHTTYSGNDQRADNPSLDAAYRSLVGGSGGLIILAMKALGLQTVWGHDPLFDYIDWYVDDAGNTGTTRFSGTYSTWSGSVWDTHRGSYA